MTETQKSETALAVKRIDAIAEVTGFTKREVALVKATVAKTATDEELMMFLRLAQKYDLDPFAHEIWAYRPVANEAMVIAAGHDGFMKTALNRPDFLGISSGTVRVGDVFEYEPTAYKIHHKHGDKRGDILGGWAMLERQGKRPAIVYVELKEHVKKNRDGQPNKFWAQWPSRMIEKVARMYAIRMAYTISGVTPADEGLNGASPGDDKAHLVELGFTPIEQVMMPDPDHAYDRDTDGNGFGTTQETQFAQAEAEDEESDEVAQWCADFWALAEETKTPRAMAQAQARKIEPQCEGRVEKLTVEGRTSLIEWVEQRRAMG
jgi:phage recombination protein Bet